MVNMDNCEAVDVGKRLISNIDIFAAVFQLNASVYGNFIFNFFQIHILNEFNFSLLSMD